MSKFNTLPLFLLLLLLASCGGGKLADVYHPLSNGRWERFDILKFEIPVEEPDNSWDVELYAFIDPSFTSEEIPFNMVMSTPSGEERIAEYILKPGSPGDPPAGDRRDSTRVTVLLKRGLSLNEKGLLRIEIENLVPRMQTEGVRGVGIRLVPSGKH